MHPYLALYITQPMADFQRSRKPARKTTRKRHHRRPPQGADSSGRITIYGFHAAAAALANPARGILGVAATENAARKLGPALSARGIEPEILDPDALAARLPEGAVHQGIAVLAAPLPQVALEAISPQGPVVALDQVTDPHNVGAILRTAAAFGAAAVIAPERGAPPPSSALAKAATGALEHVPYIQTPNLARALESLKQAGYWIVGLDGDADAPLEEIADGRPLVLVLGAEGEGLRHLTRQRCDMLARLELPGAIKSLNVSNAAAIALYAVTRPRP